jgi:hypothetical protein
MPPKKSSIVKLKSIGSIRSMGSIKTAKLKVVKPKVVKSKVVKPRSIGSIKVAKPKTVSKATKPQKLKLTTTKVVLKLKPVSIDKLYQNFKRNQPQVFGPTNMDVNHPPQPQQPLQQPSQQPPQQKAKPKTREELIKVK